MNGTNKSRTELEHSYKQECMESQHSVKSFYKLSKILTRSYYMLLKRRNL